MNTLKYGNISVEFDLSGAREWKFIRPQAVEPAGDPIPLINQALEGCTEYLGRIRSGEKVVIITSDITRYTGSEHYLPLLVDRLNASGIPDGDIEIVIALGIHRKQTEEEHRKIVGPLFGRIRVSDHECDDPGKLVYLGTTSAGIKVEINRTVAEAEHVILTGTIGFHYFAGFGGGRKTILPGVASRACCMASHFAVLNPPPRKGKNPAAVTGVLSGNPVHEAMIEACGLARPAFMLNTVLSPDKKILSVFAGDWREAHLAGCRYYGERFSFPLREQADLVVVSCGGFPKDINFIQAHKSMEYGSRALKDGGVMVLLAECRDGYGHGTFFNWFRFKDLDQFEVELRRKYEINGQTAYSTLQKAQRYHVVLVSSLPPEEVEAMGMIPAADLSRALEEAERFLPPAYSAYVIPEGGTVLPVITPSAHNNPQDS